MALYEYRCDSCGHEFELSRPMSQAAEPAQCPQCGSQARKLVSGFASTAGYGVKGTAKAPFRGEPPRAS